MAEPAVSPELLVTLTAALENLRMACRLPSGWKAVPSFRLTEKGASLLVVWRPTLAGTSSSATEAKQKRRSKSSRMRSASRAAAHKLHKEQQQLAASQQQQLNVAAPAFMPTSSYPNSAHQPGQPATGSERRRGVEERTWADLAEQGLSQPPGPTAIGPAASRPKSARRASKADEDQVQFLRAAIAEAWTNGESCSARTRQSMTDLDSLVGEGAANAWIREARELSRRGLLWK